MAAGMPRGTRRVFTIHPDAVYKSGTIADDTLTTVVDTDAGGETYLLYLCIYQTGSTASEVIVDIGAQQLRYPLAAGFGAGVDSAFTVPIPVDAGADVTLQATVSTPYSWTAGYVYLVGTVT